MESVELVPEVLSPEARTNWAANIVYSTPVLHEVGSTSEIQALVQSSEKVATAGTGHSFNFIADSVGARLSLRKHMKQVEVEEGTVTVGAGITYEELCPTLHRRGLALPNLASLTELSIAGAVSTAAHGSGNRNACLASAVVGVELATSDGELVQLGM